MESITKILKIKKALDITDAVRPDPVDPETLRLTKQIVDDVRQNGEKGLLHHAIRLGDLIEGAPHIIEKNTLKQAFDSLSIEQRNLLERTAKRIQAFAEGQKNSLVSFSMNIPGGTAGHSISAVTTAACYAPGGRYPLPSSVLMTAITARVAGVKEVWVASPKPSPVTLAAAYVAGADRFLACGGAHTIAAFAYGAGIIPACDVIVGPGNRWVTAAKYIVAGRVRIDMLAGPSECLVVADDTADPAVVAADLLAQAEHDFDARAILVSLSEDLVKKVDDELIKQLEVLPTAEIARQSTLKNGFAVIVKDIDEAISISDKIAPEHLELHIDKASELKHKFSYYGAVFVGHGSAEVFGDYGAGPNHVLPTNGTARTSGGLSVFTFLCIRTWIQLDEQQGIQSLAQDSAMLAEMEGLHGHAEAARKRLGNH